MAKASPTENDAANSEDEGLKAMGSVAGYVGGGVVGLTLLVIVWSATQGLFDKPQTGRFQELPHLAFMVEFDALDLPTQQALVGLQADLQGLDLAVSGPADYPWLVPSGSPSEPPTPRKLGELSPEEVEKSRPFLTSGSWIAPRLFSPALDQAVIRVGPPGRGKFPGGVRTRIGDLIAKWRESGSFKAIHVYSEALNFLDDDAQAAINARFGVQTANVYARNPNDPDTPIFNDFNNMVALGKAAADEKVRSGRTAQIRSIASVGSWVQYANDVRLGRQGTELDTAPWPALIKLGDELGVPYLISNDRKGAWIEVCTDAEGAANLSLCDHVAANAQPLLPGNVALYVPRNRE